MNDLISRQAAIDALEKDMASIDQIIKGMCAMDVRLDAYVSQRNQVVYDIDAITQLPPIQPKRGRWIYCEDSTADCVDGYRCDQCGFFVPWDYTHKSIDYIKDYNFCPNCGCRT